jgi:DNA polymerase I-like protein with 3'-5' exonuclease and polymerase domains/KaiC/GvpD/RAD55 family RecA-like ATPase
MHDGAIHGTLNPTKADLLNMLVYAQENDCTIAGWNVQFDVQWLIAYGCEEEVFRCKFIDGMLLWRHLSIEPEYDATGSKRKSYGLKAAVDEFMPAFAGYEEDIDFHDPSPEAREKLHQYNISDVKFTASLTQQFLSQLSRKQRKAAIIEAECIPLIASANYHGMIVDVPAVEALCAKLEQTAQEKLAELSPHGVTEEIIRSPAKLSKLLFEDWGLPQQGLTSTGEASTDKSALHELSLIDPRAQTLREYREALNNKTKFAQTILDSAAYNGDGTTHPQAHIFGTYSGRLTYSSNQGRGKEQRQTGFALHQMKRGAEYRNAIKAPNGYTLLEFDAAGQEFRWMAIASNDPNMLKLCMPGQDAHAFMGNKIDPNAADKKAARQLGKIANLSLGYRTSAKKLRTVARVQYNLPMQQPEADKIHAAYQEAYSNVPVFWKSQIAKVKREGYVETYAGRRVSIIGDWDGNHSWSMGSTAINYRIQGTGADQKYLALAVLKPYLIQIGARFAWDLHDGIYLYVPDDKVKEAAAQIKLLLDNLPYESAWGFKSPIPLPWDCKAGKSWGELKDYKINEADTPDQEGASLSISPALQPDGVKGRERLGDLGEIDKASSNLVQVDFRPQNEAALDVALKFAEAGLVVFPCLADKSPVIVGTRYDEKKGKDVPVGFAFSKKSSTDPETIKRWFLHDYKDQAAMVGLPCGANNLVVIDPDRPKPEKQKFADGLALFKQLVDEIQIDLSGVPIIVSPTGGRHYVFSQPTDGSRFGSDRGKLPQNIDVKGDNGYVIASGCRREDGKAYEQLAGTPELLSAYRLNTIPQMPDELANIINWRGDAQTITHNADALPWPKKFLERVFSEKVLANNEGADYVHWQTMCAALKAASGGSDWGFAIFDKWSQQNKFYSETLTETTWRTSKYNKATGGRISEQLKLKGFTELRDYAEACVARSTLGSIGEPSSPLEELAQIKANDPEWKWPVGKKAGQDQEPDWETQLLNKIAHNRKDFAKAYDAPIGFRATASADARHRKRLARPRITTGMIRGEVTTLVAPPSAGKSVFSTMLATAIAYERQDIAGIKHLDRCGQIVIVTNEEREDEMWNRLEAYESYWNLKPADKKHEVVVITNSESNYIVKREGKELKPAHKHLLEYIEKRTRAQAEGGDEAEIALIIIDTLASSVSGINENDNMDMQYVFNRIRALAGAAFANIIVIHHTAKSAWNAEKAELGASRGAGSSAGAVRGQIQLVPPTEDELDEYSLGDIEPDSIVKLEKSKDSYEKKKGQLLGMYRFDEVMSVVIDPRFPDAPVSQGTGILVPFEPLKKEDDPNSYVNELSKIRDVILTGAVVRKGKSGNGWTNANSILGKKTNARADKIIDDLIEKGHLKEEHYFDENRNPKQRIVLS